MSYVLIDYSRFLCPIQFILYIGESEKVLCTFLLVQYIEIDYNLQKL